MASRDDEAVVFNAALDHAAGAPRSSFLDEACAGDAAFRRRIEQLLSAYGDHPNIARALRLLADAAAVRDLIAGDSTTSWIRLVEVNALHREARQLIEP